MYGDFDFGIEHLSGLWDIRVDINYYSGGTDMDAEAVAAKDAITTASIIHPNRPLHDVRMHVTMMFTLKEAAQSVGLQSATKELNLGTDFQRTFVQIEDLDNPEVLRKLQQLLSPESSTRNQ